MNEVIQFPSVDQADPHGLVWVGGALNSSNLFNAYSRGIYPWPFNDLVIPWFSPPLRGILEFDRLVFSKETLRIARSGRYRVTMNERFDEVISRCAAPRADDTGTWITNQVQAAYRDFHRDGYAHSVEVWLGDQLVAGLYGVCVQGVFAGESMFTQVNEGSRIALYHLTQYLKARGATWIDTQMVTPHLEKLGAREIPRAEFIALLKETQKLELKLFEGSTPRELILQL
jgi:leucyl/phenylalanyl-tRNA--protein transferase